MYCFFINICMKQVYERIRENWKSRYIQQGFGQDTFSLSDVIIDLERENLDAKVTMQAFYPHAQGFHLTVITGYRVAVAMINAYTCAWNESDKSQIGSLVAAEQSMKCTSPIDEIEFGARLNCVKLKTTKKYSFAEFAYSFADGSMTGKIKGVAPTIKST